MPLFTVGETQTTLGSLLFVILVIAGTLVLGSVAKNVTQRYCQKEGHMDADGASSCGIVAQLLVWFVGFELTLHLLGIHLSSILAAGGFFAIGAGFAAKNVIENFISGTMLRIDKTIRANDVIVVEGKWLVIQHIGVRTTRATTYDGEEIFIPNALITQSMVENVTRADRSRRIQAKVGVAYESDLKLVRQVLEETTKGLPWASSTNTPGVFLDEFGDSSVNYIVFVWIDDIDDMRVRKSDLHEAVWWALKDKGVTIAFPQLDVHLGRASVNEQSE